MYFAVLSGSAGISVVLTCAAWSALAAWVASAERASIQQQSPSNQPASDRASEGMPGDRLEESAALIEAAEAAKQGEYRKVIEVLRPVASSLDTYEINHLLGEAYRREGLPVEATWHLQRAVVLRPDAVDDLLALAGLYRERRLPALTIRTLESLVSLGKGDAGVHYRLAEAYLQAGRPLGRIVITALEGAVPESNSGAWYVLDAVADQPGQFRVCSRASAIYHLQRAVELGLEDATVALLNADIWFSAGQYVKACELYEMIGAIVPREQLAGYHYRYGIALFWLDDAAGFERHLNVAVSLDSDCYKPRLLEAYTMLAERCCLRGEITQYIRYLELAVRESPREAELRYKLGNALSEAKRRAEAAAQWQVVLQLEPYHPDRERLLKLLNYQDVENSAQADPVRPQ